MLISKELREKWALAQKGERELHVHPPESHAISLMHYKRCYSFYFAFLNMYTRDMHRKRIIEIGPADYPAFPFIIPDLMDSRCTIIEPMPSPLLENIVGHFQYASLVKLPAEDYDFPESDEVWLFNVLQHTMDPDLIIEKAKASTKTIRFFEPIECGTDTCHLHDFNMDYFRKHFGDIVKYYPPFREIEGFHAHQCAYGVWENKDRK